MPRLIDADKFKGYMQDKYVMYDHTLKDIDAQPTVDAVEVVRCKDCMYSNGTLEYCSIDHWVNKDGTSFCSYGERKENAKTDRCR